MKKLKSGTLYVCSEGIVQYRLLMLILSCSQQLYTEDKRPQSNWPIRMSILNKKFELFNRETLQGTIQDMLAFVFRV